MNLKERALLCLGGGRVATDSSRPKLEPSTWRAAQACEGDNKVSLATQGWSKKTVLRRGGQQGQPIWAGPVPPLRAAFCNQLQKTGQLSWPRSTSWKKTGLRSGQQASLAWQGRSTNLRMGQQGQPGRAAPVPPSQDCFSKCASADLRAQLD